MSRAPEEQGAARPGWTGYAGVFLTALATLMYQILVTRIFSVTLWYHFAFVAVSVAMFGMTAGANLIFIRPRAFPPHKLHARLALCGALFAFSMVAALLFHLQVPFDPLRAVFWDVALKVLTYVVTAVPFFFSGLAISLALTRFPADVSRLYAADLSGAALGCLATVGLVNALGDAPTAVMVSALLAAAGGAIFAMGPGGGRRFGASAVFAALLLVLTGTMVFLAMSGRPPLKLAWAKGRREAVAPLYERWNSYSRILVTGDPQAEVQPHGWGFSPTMPRRGHPQLVLGIDATAGTFLHRFDGDPAPVEYLKYDISNIVHHLRTGARVAVIGTGGNRDVLSAIVFGQKSVVGLEINGSILEAVNGRFGDFTGHLDRRAGIRFVNEDARSYLARTDERFDILQASLIDTWAATSAGAFTLTENQLYTVEAWTIFLRRLTPGGIISFTRYYGSRELAGEVLRMMAVAVEALRRIGVREPARHLAVVRHLERREGPTPHGTGTILVSRGPFGKEDLDRLEAACRDLKFEIAYSPRGSLDPLFDRVASGPLDHAFLKTLPLNIAPSTDDSPFFFHMAKLEDFFGTGLASTPYRREVNLNAVFVLRGLLAAVLILTLLFIVLPLFLVRPRVDLRGRAPLLVFFAAIGLGFLQVEIALIQRLTLFLGHPVYALCVVLFTLLLSSGVGSFLTSRLPAPPPSRPAVGRLLLLLVVISAAGLLLPWVLDRSGSGSTLQRVLVSAAIVAVPGIFMGMAFPLGLKLAASQEERLMPWLWGINGATSVLASVLAVVIALWSGISASFWTGVFCYALATAAFCRASRPPAALGPSTA